MLQPDLFDRLPLRPFCKPYKDAQPLIRARAKALGFSYIQPNHPSQTLWLTFDIDQPGAALAWEDADLPPPTFTVARADRDDSAHLWYGLSIPVKHEADETKALRYMGRIERAMEQALGADPSFAGNFAKTPEHSAWRTYRGPGLYDLRELSEYLPDKLPEPVKRGGVLVDGHRNAGLFDSLRWWAYRHARDYKNGQYRAWFDAVSDRATLLNCQFIAHPKGPMNASEVGHTAKSVAAWVWQRQRQLDAAWIARQTNRSHRAPRVKAAPALHAAIIEANT